VNEDNSLSASSLGAFATLLEMSSGRVHMKWLHKAADLGNTIAEAMLAGIYLYGTKDVSKKIVEALRWLRALACKGNAQAQFLISEYYLEGKDGINQNIEEGFKWLHRSALGGHLYAQFTLGVLYLSDKLIPKNFVKAGKWLNKAYEQRDEDIECGVDNILNSFPDIRMVISAYDGHSEGQL